MSKRLTVTKSVTVAAEELSTHPVAIDILSETSHRLWREKAFSFHGIILALETNIGFTDKDTQKHMHRHTK